MAKWIGWIAAVWAGWFTLVAGDWPQWRGPRRDGSVDTGEAPLLALPSEPRVRWKLRVGAGWASPVVASGRVFYVDHQSGRETLHAVREASGEELWRADIDACLHDEQGPDGPRGTPLVADSFVYYQSGLGALQCRRVEDGKLVWETQYRRDFGAPWLGEDSPIPGAAEHGYTASPVIANGLLFACVGGTNGAGVVAFEAASGKLRWRSQNDLAAYAAPVVTTLGGSEQLIAFTVEGLLGLRAADGSLLWRWPLKTSYGRHCLTPVVVGDRVVTGSYQVGLSGVGVHRAGDGWLARADWTNAAVTMNFSSPVAVKGFLYGVGPAKNLVCVEAASGRLAWSYDGLFTSAAGSTFGAILVIRDHLLVMTDGGLLVLMAADPEKPRELGRVQVSGRTWSHPAYANGRLFVQDGWSGAGALRCLELAPTARP